MTLLKIIKLSNKTWKHNSDVDGDFILTKFYAKQEDNEFLLIETYGAKRRKYLIAEIEVYDIGGTAETFSNFDDLFLRLEALKYPAFFTDGEVAGVTSVTGTMVDNTNPATPIVNSDDTKLDKVSTAGVERAYIINADGSQGTKATSEFKDVIEGYFNGTNFYTDALFTNLITPESGKIYLNIAVTPATQYRWSGSAYSQIGGGTNKQIFHWWGGNWTTTNLNQYYYIGFNGGAIIQQDGSGAAATTITAAMNGRNKGLFIAPFNCKIKRVMFKEGGSGSYTGAFVLASGLPNYGGTWNLAYTNVVTHLNQAISATGYEQHKNEFLVTDNITVPKGYAVCPMLVFSAQSGATKVGVEISIEIEEVV